ncbi:MAG: efflux RND transporter periplasmic adaptor subunit [Saprospiraceae bacterium]|jgi:multidrug efflux system membrane fusion protein|nr:efflux RND transporter periplasmic adaptor subunit [Saprospiraceae bacterium]MDG1433856.1 efflux RND transporter periplasmic adaptor subunit [Saprospiraceae bacterium]MDG2418077.1 efflux RND transporter periplasmic adaptor subunit [Saprospiraceae bacterium]
MKHFIFFLLFIFVFSCRVDHHQNESTEPARQKNFVKVETVETKTDPIPIQTIGRLGSDTEHKLSFKIGGFISSLKVKEGDFVRKGDLLGTMRTNEIDAQVLKAKRAVQKAYRDLERVKSMFADSVATSENVDDLTTLLQVSEADLGIAKFNQKYAKIISPVNGRVIRKLSEPNELVSPGQPILIVASSQGSTYVMKVSLSDKDVNRVKLKSQAEVGFDAFPNELFYGQISNIAESADPLTGTFEVKISIDSKNKRLRNGSIGRAKINPKDSEPYLELPILSIVEGDQKELMIFIPTESDTIAKMVKVELIHITNHSIFIKKPVEGTIEKVITTGAAYLIDGDRIYIK